MAAHDPTDFRLAGFSDDDLECELKNRKIARENTAREEAEKNSVKVYCPHCNGAGQMTDNRPEAAGGSYPCLFCRGVGTFKARKV